VRISRLINNKSNCLITDYPDYPDYPDYTDDSDRSSWLMDPESPTVQVRPREHPSLARQHCREGKIFFYLQGR
jgi:hypothetical protein